MPFITEEIWHLISIRKETDCIIVAPWPKTQEANEKLLLGFEQAQAVVTNVRNMRGEKGLSPKVALELAYKGAFANGFTAVIKKLANLESVTSTESKVEKSYSFIVGTTEYFIPFNANVDVTAERERLHKELEYNKGFLDSVMKKLSNQNFVSKAKPEIIASEEKKKADAVSKIKSLEEQLNSL